MRGDGGTTLNWLKLEVTDVLTLEDIKRVDSVCVKSLSVSGDTIANTPANMVVKNTVLVTSPTNGNHIQIKLIHKL